MKDIYIYISLYRLTSYYYSLSGELLSTGGEVKNKNNKRENEVRVSTLPA